MSSQEVKGKDVVSKEVNYSKLNRVAPRYKFSKIYPSTNSQTVTLNNTGTTDTVFEIPAKVFNFAQSILKFKLTLYESATAGHYLWRWVDNLAPIIGVEVYTRTGTYLMKVSDGMPNWLSVARRKETKLENYLQNETTSKLYKSNSAANTNYRCNNTGGDVAYLETKYLEVGVVRNGAGAGNVVDYYEFNLGQFVDTLCALDKDVVFPEVINFKIIWNSTYRICWSTNSNTDPSATLGSYNSASPAKIEDLALYLALEQETSLVKDVLSAMESGKLVFLFPYLSLYKQNINGSPSHVLTRKMTRGDGMSLLKVVSIPYDETEDQNTTYDHSNINYDRVSSLYTSIDSNKLSEFDINCKTNEDIDYMVHKDRLKGSLYLSKDIYKFNWFYEDDFTGTKISDEKSVDDSNVVAGIPLDREIKYDLYATMKTSQTDNWYMFYVTQRAMKIGPNDIEMK